jgi:hypothetical protein
MLKKELMQMSDESIKAEIEYIKEHIKQYPPEIDQKFKKRNENDIKQLRGEQRRRNEKRQQQIKLEALLLEHRKWFDIGYTSDVIFPPVKPDSYIISVSDDEHAPEQYFVVIHKDRSRSRMSDANFLGIVIVGLKKGLC